MRSTVISIVRYAVLAYLGYAALLFVLQRRLLFPGVARDPGRSAASPVPEGVRRVWLEPPGGRVEAWFIAPEGGGPAPALIFAHGNGELIDDWTALGSLADLGLGVLLVEFPGYGLSAGRPSRGALRQTFAAAYDWLVAQPEVDGERIVSMGRSIGGGAATDLVTERPVRALILQSTFSSTARMAWEGYKAPGFLVRDRFDNEAVVRSFDGPVLLIHGQRDEVIPYEHALRLSRANERAELITLACGHNDCPPDWSAFIASIRDFLTSNGVLRGDDPEG